MRLTNNFWLREFTKSPTAIRHGIPNNPGTIQVDNLVALCKNVLQPLRDNYGKAIKINSGYRSLQLNEKISRSKTSQHCYGEAADIDTLEDNSWLFNYIRNNLLFDQLIWEFGDDNSPDWVHVSFKENHNRGEVLKALKVHGKTKYIRL